MRRQLRVGWGKMGLLLLLRLLLLSGRRRLLILLLVMQVLLLLHLLLLLLVSLCRGVLRKVLQGWGLNSRESTGRVRLLLLLKQWRGMGLGLLGLLGLLVLKRLLRHWRLPC